MLQELLDRDGLRFVVVESGQVFRHGVVQAQFPLVGQHLHGDARQRFGHRADVEDRAALHGSFVFAIALSVDLVQDCLAVLDDQQLASDDRAVLHVLFHLAGHSAHGRGRNALAFGCGDRESGLLLGRGRYTHRA